MVEDTYQSVCNDGINVFEGVAVEFLAAIAVDHVKGIPEEAYHFKPTLSGFVKIAQMLVIQKAVVCARDVGIIQPTDLLNEVQMRFLINGVRSPFSWVSKLRVYRKKVSQDYLPLVDGFLERTLLLIHLTAGRPVCGSEILSLRHVNVAKGHYRNTFFEVSGKDDCPGSGARFVHLFTCQTDPTLSVIADDATNPRSMIKAHRIISIAS
jgi:hypothetical protein